jgi:hypothetical protein
MRNELDAILFIEKEIATGLLKRLRLSRVLEIGARGT